MNRLLVTTDLSSCSAHAASRAAILAAGLKTTTLDLMTVIDPSIPGALERMLKGTPEFEKKSLTEHAMQALQSIAHELKNETGVTCNCYVEFGRPAYQIEAKAEELPADLVVVGAHGCNSINRFFIGNTPYKLLHIGKQPLLIVKNRPERPYQNILVPVDFSAHSRIAAQTALVLVPNANVTLLNVFGVPQESLMRYSSVSNDFIHAYRVGAKDIAEKAMAHFIDSLDAGERMISWTHQLGYPPSAIHEYAEKSKPDLIVMGKRGQNPVQDFLLGSVTRSTIDNTDCDILISLPDNA